MMLSISRVVPRIEWQQQHSSREAKKTL
jgi:hypothetical protein